MKKRVMTVWDGQRRLAKDDMMLSSDFEVRVPLPRNNGVRDNTISPLSAGSGSGSGSWVTDLDVQTLRRADGFHMATEEERGPWMPTNYINAPQGYFGHFMT